MKKTTAFLALFVAFSFTVELSAQDGSERHCTTPIKEFFKSKRQKNKEDAAKRKSSTPEEKKYEDLVREATVTDGLVRTILTKDDRLYFEVPDSVMGQLLLISNRISSTSNNKDFVAGQMVTDPFMVRFRKQGKSVYLHAVQTESFVDEEDPIRPSFEKNNIEPILRSFKVMAEKGKNVVIDVTDMFQAGEANLSPMKTRTKLPTMPLSGAAHFTKVKSFPQNVEVKCMLGYKSPQGYPYTIEVHRSVVLLPQKPMHMRLQDNRVGYFYSDRERFTTSLDKVEKFKIINRWRLEPKDSAAYFRGELVEPIKPIVFYVDTVFPTKWKSAVLAGVMDWNKAFEAAGFKNAVVVREYPSKAVNPDFDPDDMRYSCIKYATTEIANAMGPSYIDPRSGEILNADVIWYHNVLSLLHNWRFVQTAAVDPRVRTNTFPDEVMAESMRYVCSHEIGHTLGLMHNMGASFSFPVDSLRSPSFTQKYGTTPSIMDYARNNFVAQPGDKERGVRLIPPLIGVYDIYAINWGYRLIPGVKNYREERATLNKWIEEKANDPMYEFGAQQITTLDPTDQTEDLGNDHMKAGNYAISNLKIIKANYEKWLLSPDDRVDDLGAMYSQLMKQFIRHLTHVTPYIGGRIYFENRQGDGKAPVTYISKDKQKEALSWVMKQVRDVQNWLITSADRQKFDQSGSVFSSASFKFIPTFIMRELLFSARFQGVIDGCNAPQGGTGYSVQEYVQDFAKEVFAKTYKGEKLSSYDMGIEDAALQEMLLTLFPKASVPSMKGLDVDKLCEELTGGDHDLPCMDLQAVEAKEEGEFSFFRPNALPDIPREYEINPVLLDKVKEIRSLYKKRAASSSDRATREFYQYWEENFKKTFDR